MTRLFLACALLSLSPCCPQAGEPNVHQSGGNVEDVARAFAWTHKNIAKHGGDPANIFVCGHSAGGHLVSLLSTNPTYLRAHDLKISDIKGTIPLSGVFVLLPNQVFKDIFTMDK